MQIQLIKNIKICTLNVVLAPNISLVHSKYMPVYAVSASHTDHCNMEYKVSILIRKAPDMNPARKLAILIAFRDFSQSLNVIQRQ
jgi:hypothetical protein